MDVIIAASPFPFGGNVLYAAIGGGVLGAIGVICQEIARRRRLKEWKKLAEESGVNWEQFVFDCKKAGKKGREMISVAGVWRAADGDIGLRSPVDVKITEGDLPYTNPIPGQIER